MKHEWLGSFLLLAFIAALLGYGILAAQPRPQEVSVKVEQMLSASERESIDTSILSGAMIDQIQDLKIFGIRPTPVNSTNRANPFEGL